MADDPSVPPSLALASREFRSDLQFIFAFILIQVDIVIESFLNILITFLKNVY